MPALYLDCVFSYKPTDFLKLKIIYKGNLTLHKSDLKVKCKAIKTKEVGVCSRGADRPTPTQAFPGGARGTEDGKGTHFSL